MVLGRAINAKHHAQLNDRLIGPGDEGGRLIVVRVVRDDGVIQGIHHQ